MALSKEVRRGQSNMAHGIDSDIWLGPDVTTSNLAEALEGYNVEVGTVAYNRKWLDGLTGAIKATHDLDGKWYCEDGTEVT